MLARRFMQALLAVATVLAACSGGRSTAVSSGSGGVATGGAPASGGAPAAGGAPATGGSTSNGGAPADSGPDTGPMDSGEPDATDAADVGAGPPPVVSAPAIACTDTLANVYVTPAASRR